MPNRELRIVTFTGPSGAGKTTIIGELTKTIPDSTLLVSLTTRAARDSDLPGEYQCGVTLEEFAKRETRGEFLWTVEIHGNKYGTLRQSVDDALSASHLTLMHLMPDTLHILRSYVPAKRLLSFFILPPPEAVLRERLAGRGETQEAVSRRISDCQLWIKEAATSNIPYLYVNNDSTIHEVITRVMFLISEAQRT